MHVCVCECVSVSACVTAVCVCVCICVCLLCVCICVCVPCVQERMRELLQAEREDYENELRQLGLTTSLGDMTFKCH